MKTSLKISMLLSSITVVGIASASYLGQKAYKNRKRGKTSLIYAVSKTDQSGSNLASKIDRSLNIKKTDTIAEAEDAEAQQEIVVTPEATLKPARSHLPLENAMSALTVSSVSIGFVAASTFWPPLKILALPSLIYFFIPLYRKSFRDLKEGKATISILVTLILGGLVVQGKFLVGNLLIVARSLSKMLNNKVQHTTQQNLKNAFQLQPRSVWLLKDGAECEIPFESLELGDLIVVHAGEMIPVDGTIVSGISSVDQHALTGESQPAEKEAGDQVLASTVVLSGQLCIKVEKTGDDTIVGQIIEILNDASGAKSEIQLRAEKITDQTVLPTLIISGLSLPFLGTTGALAILCSHFKYRLSTVAPLSMLNHLNLASQDGILIKDGITLDFLNQVDTIVFDKTGTLTQEEPHIGRIHVFDFDHDPSEVLRLAAAAEYKQSHPVAKAILKEAEKQTVILPEIDESNYKVGYGLSVTMDEQLIRVGSVRFMEMEEINMPSQAAKAIEDCYQQGHSLVCVALNEKLIGALEMHATVRPEARQIVRTLRDDYNIASMYIISGDHEAPTKRLAKELGIDNYFAETLPQNKAELIKQLQEEGKKVCYIGDGINDSIALQQSDVSVSMRGASTMATDTAQIILMDGTLNKLPGLFDIGREFDRNMKTSWGIVLLATVANFSGVLFMGVGVVGVMIINRTSLVACISTVMLPSIRARTKQMKADAPIEIGLSSN